MNLYIADTHFGHSNILLHDHRPFPDADTMDSIMIELWNSRVSKDDEVWILGDFCYRSGREPEWYLKQLRGHKHFIVGNHDRHLLKDEKALSYFESVDSLKMIKDGDSARGGFQPKHVKKAFEMLQMPYYAPEKTQK